jgi:hypothetical protein
MNVSRIEDLLEMLVVQNQQMLEKLESIEYEARSINSELNWVGETAFAKQVVDSISYVSSSINSVESAISSVETAIYTTQP